MTQAQVLVGAWPLAAFCCAALAHDLPAPAAADTVASDTVITPLLEETLSARDAAVASMLTVEYAPGAATPPHTHPADTFVYVLSGAIEMQVAGGELKRLQAGDTYYERPADQHIVSRNASSTLPAKFLVMFVKAPGAPVLEPLPEQKRANIERQQ